MSVLFPKARGGDEQEEQWNVTAQELKLNACKQFLLKLEANVD